MADINTRYLKDVLIDNATESNTDYPPTQKQIKLLSETKADKTELEDVSNVIDSELALKADKTELDLKADKTELENIGLLDNGVAIGNFAIDANGNLLIYGAIKERGIGAEAILNTNYTGTIALIGDSITHGSQMLEAYNNAYAGILRKAIQKHYNQEDYGFEPIQTYADRDLIHEVTKAGTWTYDVYSSPTGRAFESSTAGDTITISVPSAWAYFDIGFIPDNSCTASITVNGVIAKDSGGANVSIDSTDTLGDAYEYSKFALMEDNGRGFCDIVITVLTGSVKVFGLRYANNLQASFLDLYAQSGRTIEHLDDEMLDMVTSKSNSIIFALGQNDKDKTGTARDTVIAKLDLLKVLCIAKNKPLVMLDFLWDEAQDHWLKTKFREIERDVNWCHLIDYGRLLATNELGYFDSAALSDSTLFWDTQHPNVQGHSRIADILLNALKIDRAGGLWCDGYGMENKYFAMVYSNTTGTTVKNEGTYFATVTPTATGIYQIDFEDRQSGVSVPIGARRWAHVFSTTANIFCTWKVSGDGIEVTCRSAVDNSLTDAYISLMVEHQEY